MTDKEKVRKLQELFRKALGLELDWRDHEIISFIKTIAKINSQVEATVIKGVSQPVKNGGNIKKKKLTNVDGYTLEDEIDSLIGLGHEIVQIIQTNEWFNNTGDGNYKAAFIILYK